MFLTASLESQFWNLKGIIKKTHNACVELFFLNDKIYFFWTNISYQLSEDSFHFFDMMKNVSSYILIGHCFITPLKNPALRDGFLRGVWKEIAKKVHNGSENSENKKKYGVV